MTRSGQVTAGHTRLVTLLVVLGLIGGAYFGCRTLGSKAEPESDEVFQLHCGECQKTHEIPGIEARGRPRKNQKVLCPICNTYSASWEPPREHGGVISP